jgi:hypothetical protein
MGDARDVTGVWYGRYVGATDPQENSSIAVLEEQAGAFDGTITEPDDEGGGGIRRAHVTGRRTGSTLVFVKQYDGSNGWGHAVRYAGSIDGEGTEISGSWKLDWVFGSFVMEREKFSEAELDEAVEAETELPVER